MADPEQNPYRTEPGEDSSNWHDRHRRALKTGDKVAQERLNQERAWDECRARKELDQLLPTVEAEAKYLAEMYVWAKHFGRDKEYTELLGRVMKLQVQKVRDAAAVFGKLYTIYETISFRADSEHGIVRKYWDGEMADQFSKFFTENKSGLVSSIHGPAGSRSLSDLAKQTSTLIDAFADALQDWRDEVAKAIKELARLRREEVMSTVGEWLDVGVNDPVQIAAQALDALLKTVNAIDTAKQREDLVWFDEFVRRQDAKRAVPDDDKFSPKDYWPREYPEPRLA